MSSVRLTNEMRPGTALEQLHKDSLGSRLSPHRLTLRPLNVDEMRKVLYDRVLCSDVFGIWKDRHAELHGFLYSGMHLADAVTSGPVLIVQGTCSLQGQLA